MSFKTTVITILIYFYAACGATAQEPTNYSAKNGLPTNHVYDVQEDKDGVMWFATNRGLVKFDGKNFKAFTIKEGLPNNDVWELYLDGKKRLWVFSKSRYQSYVLNDSIYNFATSDGKTISPAPIYEVDNALWLRAGYYKFDGAEFKVQNDYATFYHGGSQQVFQKHGLNAEAAAVSYDFIFNQYFLIKDGELWFLNADGTVLKK
ncbi:two-component regulator propeller domain-containing protein [Niabella ginsengisoli]|uniref:Histidine kinase n=1 Tax=Niabella ginsengisoli TaxID=522298 RepID=A0ABS9SQA4_9BACT|nr:two-component regulator propeller domain-containing protein [Niabella ginsengisoli]MCH5600556.1 hypothetical protein [Niabella ginsengisoli]